MLSIALTCFMGLGCVNAPRLCPTSAGAYLRQLLFDFRLARLGFTIMDERVPGLDVVLPHRAARLALVAAAIFHVIACTNVPQSSPRAAAGIQRAPFGKI